MTSALAAAQKGAATALFIVLALLIINLVHVSAQTRCSNGGTYNGVLDVCKCTPDFHGKNCETSFTSSDPCTSASTQEVNDMAASHRPDNTQYCSAANCIDFNSLRVGWYRLKSPAGGFLTEGCLQQRPETCGSERPFVLVDILQEANPNRQLYSAKLASVDQNMERGPGSSCTTSPHLPVRILKCGSYNVYFLLPTNSKEEHYCIGNKKKCSAGLASSDGSGYEPCFNKSICIAMLKTGAAAVLPVISQTRVALSNGRHYDTWYNCIVRDSFQTSMDIGVLYRIFYRLTYFNHTSKVIDNCTFTDIRIDSGAFLNMSCNSKSFLFANSDHYGGTLECVVQAKCNFAESDYVSQELASVAHRFEFLYSFVSPETQMDHNVITPSKPINLCIDISKVPGGSDKFVELRVSARRRALMAKDKIELEVYNTSRANYTDSKNSNPCVIEFWFSLSRTNDCYQFRLLNNNEEGLIPYGLNPSQLAPMIEVNISYRSNFLKRRIEATDPWVRLQSRQLIVNITALYADEIKEYFHIYCDPVFKAANSETIYWGTADYSRSDGCGVLMLMKNKIIPFEVQAMECFHPSYWFNHSAVVDIAIRYDNYIIRINSPNNTFSYRVWRLSNGRKSGSPLKSDQLPRGVTIERTDSAVRLKLDIYGTIMYFWGFVIFHPPLARRTDCYHNFIQSRESIYEFNKTACPPFLTANISDYTAIDTIIIPGFYDTKSRVDGLMYRQDYGQWNKSLDLVVRNSQRDMFSDNFVADRAVENHLTEWENLCTCTDDTKPVANSDTCVVSNREINRRKKRSLDFPDMRPLLNSPARASSSSVNPLPSAAVNITAVKAAEMCDAFIRAMNATGKAVTVTECSKFKGILDQVDYVTQFKENCIQYAVRLQTYNYTEFLFNALVGRCLLSLSYHMPTVTNKSSLLLQMQEEQCPSNCSGKGVCISGSCNCYAGFTGAACETSVAAASAQPTVVTKIDLYNMGVMCASAECTMAYFSVSPYLRSTNPVCLMRSDSVGYRHQSATEPLTSNILRCPIGNVHDWLKTNKKRSVVVSVQLLGNDWGSNNTVNILAYQKKCHDGDTVCSADKMSCTSKNSPSTSDADTSTCNPENSNNSGSTPSLQLWTILLSAVFVVWIEFT